LPHSGIEAIVVVQGLLAKAPAGLTGFQVMKVKLSQRAQADLRRIAGRIARDNPRAAEHWVRRIRDRVRLAGRSPGLGRRVPELDRDDVREAVVGNYRLVYVIRAKHVVIQTIFEGHMLLPEVDP
jgi:plasmid stabilization system protein ParE